MATNPNTLAENVGRITPPDANYPYASAKDDSTGTTGDGTPIKAAMLNDTYGFIQASLVAAGIVPSGNPETAVVSQVLQSLQGVVGSFSDKSQWPTVANGADTDHDIDFGAGKITDSTGSRPIISPAITKRIDAAWAVGNNAGGLFANTVTVFRTYHCFLIVRDSDGAIDAGFDVDPAAPNIPTGYTAFRRIASIYTGASANIVQFFQRGDRFTLRTPENAYSSTATLPSTSDTIIDLAVPDSLPNIQAHLSVAAIAIAEITATGGAFTVQSLEEVSAFPSVLNTPWVKDAKGFDGTASSSGMLDLLAGNTAQAKVRGTDLAPGVMQLVINTFGWTDDRG